MTERTKGPWSVNHGVHITIERETDRIAWMYSAGISGEEDADSIVQALNGYDVAVEALEAIVAIGCVYWDQAYEYKQIARAALAKIRGEG